MYLKRLIGRLCLRWRARAFDPSLLSEPDRVAFRRIQAALDDCARELVGARCLLCGENTAIVRLIASAPGIEWPIPLCKAHRRDRKAHHTVAEWLKDMSIDEFVHFLRDGNRIQPRTSP
jgi:hypothetical protein